MIEHDPHQLIEGMILASYAIGAQRALFIAAANFSKELAKLRTSRRTSQRRDIWENIFWIRLFP